MVCKHTRCYIIGVHTAAFIIKKRFWQVFYMQVRLTFILSYRITQQETTFYLLSNPQWDYRMNTLFRSEDLVDNSFFSRKLFWKLIYTLIYLCAVVALYRLGEPGCLLFWVLVGIACNFIVADLDTISRALGSGLPVTRMRVCIFLSVCYVIARLFLYDIGDDMFGGWWNGITHWAVLMALWCKNIFWSFLDRRSGTSSLFTYVSHVCSVSVYILSSIVCFAYLIGGVESSMDHRWLGVSGAYWAAYILLSAKLSDIGGIIFGKAFGQRLVAYNDGYIRTGKTMEGYIGSLTFVIVGSLACGYNFMKAGAGVNLVWFVIGSAILALWSIMGDILESLMKRSASNISLAGDGVPALDFFDSLFIMLPASVMGLSILDAIQAG